MKSDPENIYLSKDLFLQFSWSTECLILHPEFPLEGVEAQQLQSHRVPSPQRQMSDALVVQSLTNVLSKCHFVVDTPSMDTFPTFLDNISLPFAGSQMEKDASYHCYFPDCSKCKLLFLSPIFSSPKDPMLSFLLPRFSLLPSLSSFFSVSSLMLYPQLPFP